MSTLSSSSTNAQVMAAYDDNASFAEDGSVAKARAFVTACRILLRRRPSEMSGNGRTVSWESVREEMQTAQEYCDGNADASTDPPRVTRADFRDFR